MRTALIASATLLVVTAATTATMAGTPLPRSTPEKQGIPSKAILEFIQAADQRLDSMNSFMLVRHGQVVAEGWWAPYAPEIPHELYSLSKSFTSTAVGFAVAEGKLSIDDPVTSFFPDEAPADTSANLKAMRVRDLLCMSAGHQNEIPSAADTVCSKAFLGHPVPFKPGTHFLYNTPATFMCSAIVQKVTGQTVADYLGPRLFGPLGIDSPRWDTNFQGISLGGSGLNVRTEDIAKFGQFYLQKGKWKGKQLLPAEWIAMATARQTSNGSNPKSDWDQGYGFQFWRCRHGAYRGDGAFGQYCLVMPEQDVVIAITSGLGDMQAVLNLIWDKLLPQMQPRPLHSNAQDLNQLECELKALKMKPETGAETSTAGARWSGKKIKFDSNAQKLDWAMLKTGSNGGNATITLSREGTVQKVECGYGKWVPGQLTLPATRTRLSAATYAWPAEDTLTAKVVFYETPFVLKLTLQFSDGKAVLASKMNIGFGPQSKQVVEGHPE